MTHGRPRGHRLRMRQARETRQNRRRIIPSRDLWHDYWQTKMAEARTK